MQHVVRLVSELPPRSRGAAMPCVYAQTEKPRGGIGKLLSRLGFEETAMKTGDGYALWEAKINAVDEGGNVRVPIDERNRLAARISLRQPE
jgi:hypothetical protein